MENQKSIQNVNGYVFVITAQIIFTTAYNVIYTYPSKLPILRRETGEQIYDLSAYYVAVLLCTIPKSFIECFCFLIVGYPIIGFAQGFWQFLQIGISLTITSIPAAAYGMMMSGIYERNTADMAAGFDMIFFILAGVYIRLDRFWFMKFFTPFFYANESILILIWKNVTNLGKLVLYNINRVLTHRFIIL